MVIISALEAPAVVSGLDDIAVMGQAIEQRGGHLGVAEDARPFAEGEVGGDDDRGALVEPADEVEQELAAGLSEWQIAEFVEDDEVHAGQVIGEPALPAVAGLGLEPVDEIDHVVEPAAGAAADAASGNRDGQVGLAGPVPPTSTALRCWSRKPPPARSCTSVWLIGVPSNWKSSRSLASGSLAMVSWYLIERACFSLISALSRSPTMRSRFMLAFDSSGHDLVEGRLHTVELGVRP